MLSEHEMNFYYNTGKFNSPSKIGYMMNMIRDLQPLTEDEWRIWYLENVHDEGYLWSLAEEMRQTIPEEEDVSVEDCYLYICDVMFRRTFQGYNKERQALKLLREKVSPDIKESSGDWDTLYFIDFYVKKPDGKLIGIQLKPETFYQGGYQNVVDIEGKMAAFREEYDAKTYILTYQRSKRNELIFCEPSVVDEIKEELSR